MSISVHFRVKERDVTDSVNGPRLIRTKVHPHGLQGSAQHGLGRNAWSGLSSYICITYCENDLLISIAGQLDGYSYNVIPSGLIVLDSQLGGRNLVRISVMQRSLV